MNESIPANDSINDERKLVVNGRKYYIMTANRCPNCTGDDRYMFIKQKLVVQMVTIECPNCDYYTTVNENMINWNLNK